MRVDRRLNPFFGWVWVPAIDDTLFYPLPTPSSVDLQTTMMFTHPIFSPRVATPVLFPIDAIR